MKWKVASSMLSRLLVMAFTLAVVMMVTNKLGADAQGTAALIQLGILLIVSVTNFIGGGAVVYLLPRVGARFLLVPAYIWSTAVTAVFALIYHWIDIVPHEYLFDVLMLGWLQAMFTFHMQVLLGKERIHRFNVIVTLQAFWLAACLAAFIYVFNLLETRSYVRSLYISFIITYLIGLFSGWKHFKEPQKTRGNAFKEMWAYGRYAQLGNILQLLTYRSNLTILEKMMTLSASGMYSLVLYAGEAIWNVGKSLALVQGARIANSENEYDNRKLTARFMKVSAVGSITLIFLMLILPDRFYQLVFGEEMAGLHGVLLWASPGILANACSMIYSHYFSGVGKHVNNTIGSGVGLAALFLAVYPLVWNFGVAGAAMAASIGFIAQFIAMATLYHKSRHS